MSGNEPLMAVVVVNFGSHSLLAANVAGLDWPALGCRLIVVDNFHSAAEREAVSRLAAVHGFVLVPLAGNRGFGAGVNAGFAEGRRLGCEVFLTLNPDARITAEVVTQLREQSLADRLALICPTVVTPAGTPEFQGSQVGLADGRIRGLRVAELPQSDEVRLEGLAGRLGPEARGWLTGACLVLHRELLDRVGGFDERYFLYWEDIDLSLRCVDAGGTLILRRDLTIVHDEGGTQQPGSGRAKSDTYYYYNCRNRLVFASGRLTRRALLRWILRTPAVSREILLRGGRRQLVQSPRPLLAAVRGSLAGLAAATAALVGRRGPAPLIPVRAL